MTSASLLVTKVGDRRSLALLDSCKPTHFSGWVVDEAKNEYYKAFISCEENRRIAGLLDIYPFLYFFSHRVYARFGHGNPAKGDYRIFFATGQVTQKEDELWKYINEHFREEAFSTKQLEKRYGKAAYRTIRSFVGKFEREGLLEKINYSSRPKYRLAE